MEQTLTSSVLTFCYALILGAGLGFIYDIFRIIRILINPKNLGFFIQDIIYFIFAGVITFAFVLTFNHGHSRFYILAGEGIGWIVYHITIGEFIYKRTSSICDRIRKKKSKKQSN